MNTHSIQDAVQEYLRERRQLGFELTISGTQLMNFARYADVRSHTGALTTDIQLAWARSRGTRPLTWARRLEVVRPFAKYFRQFEPATEVPDPQTFGPSHRRLTPHIYSEEEIIDLLGAASRLHPAGGLRPATYRALFGLIAAAGLRISEALKLQRSDVDMQAGTITVRETKFRKSRCLPLHTSTTEALSRYRDVRDRAVGPDPGLPFFVSDKGRPLANRTVHGVFAKLRTHLGWVARGGHANPRIHDLRHTFSVRRLLLWSQSGVAPDHGTFWLCTYLGHAKISDTYWYLTGTPELLSLVGGKFEQFASSSKEVCDV